MIAPALFLPLAETATHVSACPGYRRAPQQKRRLCNHWYQSEITLSPRNLSEEDTHQISSYLAGDKLPNIVDFYITGLLS